MAKKAANPEPKAEKKASSKSKEATKVKEVTKAKVAKPAAKASVKEKPEKVKKSTQTKAELTAANEDGKKWTELRENHGSEKAISYSMNADIPANTPIQHKVFGWGYVISSDNNRLQVLFESGIKQLISNYKR